MNEYDVKRLALVLAIQAEIEAMKTLNLERQMGNWSLAYTEADFQQKAEELKELAYKHNEQL